jgi:hypothetical protein
LADLRARGIVTGEVYLEAKYMDGRRVAQIGDVVMIQGNFRGIVIDVRGASGRMHRHIALKLAEDKNWAPGFLSYSGLSIPRMSLTL